MAGAADGCLLPLGAEYCPALDIQVLLSGQGAGAGQEAAGDYRVDTDNQLDPSYKGS